MKANKNSLDIAFNKQNNHLRKDINLSISMNKNSLFSDPNKKS